MNLLSNPKLFPACMIVLNILASAVYAAQRDVRHAVYWAASAVLITAVTY